MLAPLAAEKSLQPRPKAPLVREAPHGGRVRARNVHARARKRRKRVQAGAAQPRERKRLFVAQEGVRRALPRDAPRVHHEHAVGAQHVLDEVRDLEHAAPRGAHAPHEVGHELASGRVQLRRHLVEHQVARLHGQHARKREPLLLPARELHHRTVGEPLQVARLERTTHATLDLCGLEPEVARPEGDLVAHARRDELRPRVLLDVAHLLEEGAPRPLARHLAVHLDDPCRRLDRAVGKPRERRLAAAVAPEQHHVLARRHLKRGAAQHALAARVRKLDVTQAKHASFLQQGGGPTGPPP